MTPLEVVQIVDDIINSHKLDEAKRIELFAQIFDNVDDEMAKQVRLRGIPKYIYCSLDLVEDLAPLLPSFKITAHEGLGSRSILCHFDDLTTTS